MHVVGWTLALTVGELPLRLVIALERRGHDVAAMRRTMMHETGAASAVAASRARYALAGMIPNEASPSFVSELSFHPNGETIGATYEHLDEVRIHSAKDLSTVRVLRNPSAGFDGPHGILLTSRHLIVTNKRSRPSQLLVFSLNDESDTPIQTYTTPYAHLAEAHSLALHGRRLIVTYCEGPGKRGAIVSYEYDDESGRIVGPSDLNERWFRRYGDAKGVAFDQTGDKVFVTFASDVIRRRRRMLERLKRIVSFRTRGATNRNGIAAFAVDRQGRFTHEPVWTKVFPTFCRLENIHVHGDRAVVTNADAGCVYVYDLGREDPFAEPAEVITDQLVFPHGVKISPDGRLLAVSDNGIEVVDHWVQWTTFVSPRRDRVVLFERQVA